MKNKYYFFLMILKFNVIMCLNLIEKYNILFKVLYLSCTLSLYIEIVCSV